MAVQTQLLAALHLITSSEGEGFTGHGAQVRNVVCYTDGLTDNQWAEVCRANLYILVSLMFSGWKGTGRWHNRLDNMNWLILLINLGKLADLHETRQDMTCVTCLMPILLFLSGPLDVHLMEEDELCF